MTEEQTLVALKSAFKISGGVEICQAAMRDVLGERSSDANWIKQNFSYLIEEVQVRAYEKYLTVERPAGAAAFRKVLGPELSESPSKDEVFDLLEAKFHALDRFFLGLTQGRRPRAGKAFEQVIKVLFDTLQYPYSPQAVINGKPDFLLPSVDYYRENAMDCIIFTVKRTLRERWRQIITEGTRGHQFFLATIDSGVSSNDLTEMLRNRVYLVVPDAIKASKYGTERNVITFETFFRDHLDPAITRWRANGVI